MTATDDLIERIPLSHYVWCGMNHDSHEAQCDCDFPLRMEAAAELTRLRERVEQRDRQIDVYNSGGFVDADALAERFVTLMEELDTQNRALAQCRALLKQEIDDVVPLRERVAALEAENAECLEGAERWQAEGLRALSANTTLRADAERLRQKLPEILGVLAGAASLCWTPNPTGEFDSTLASHFVDRALKECDAAREKP